MTKVYQVLKRRANDADLWHPKVLVDPRGWVTGSEKIKFETSPIPR